MQKKVHYKLVASFFCFCFVFVWHGMEDCVLIWVMMNYIGFIIEYYSKILLGPNSMDIIKNVLAAPLWAICAVSNFYFFGGKDIGDIFFRKFFGKNIM